MSDCIEPTTLQAWRAEARQRCDHRHHADIDWLIQHTLRSNRAALISRSDLPLSQEITSTLNSGIAALRDDVPLAHLIGTQPFWTMELILTTDTLVPRADTEILVHAALSRLPGDHTGAALEVARLNAQSTEIDNVTFFEGDWAEGLPSGQYDVIVSNPPYVETDDGALPSNLRHEPEIALAGGPDGLEQIRRLVPAAVARLKAGGWLMIEHGNMQAAGVSGILYDSGLTDLDTVPDIAGRDRVSLGKRPALPEA